MELSYRTFLRHAVLAGMLIAALFFIQGFQGFSVRALAERNAGILGAWFIACFPLGWLAHRLVVGGQLKRWTTAIASLLTGRSAFQLYRAHMSNSPTRRTQSKGPPAGLTGLFLKWASCSRCVAWWAGGGFSFALHFVYWPAWPAALYFAALGASLSAATAVFFYLRAFMAKAS